MSVGTCCSTQEALKAVPDSNMTDEQKNRCRYALLRITPVKMKKIGAIYRSYKDKYYCGDCGFGFNSDYVIWKFCPNCGRMIWKDYMKHGF